VQVRLPDDDGAGVAQLFHHERVTSGLEAIERQRPARGRHVGGRVIVLDHDGDAVERTADVTRAPLGVERGRRVERVGVQRDERVDARPVLVIGLDASEILLDELARRRPVRFHLILQVEDRLLDDIEPGRRRERRFLRVSAEPCQRAGKGD